MRNKIKNNKNNSREITLPIKISVLEKKIAGKKPVDFKGYSRKMNEVQQAGSIQSRLDLDLNWSVSQSVNQKQIARKDAPSLQLLDEFRYWTLTESNANKGCGY